MRLAIVGAGMAGLAAAHKLSQTRPDLAVTLYEKSRGVGGRVATRHAYGAVFDHGAQYIKAPSQQLEALLRTGSAQPVDIPAPVWTFDASGTIEAGDPQLNHEGKWTYADGITRLAKQLAGGLDIRSSLRVGRFEHDGGTFRLFDAEGEQLDTFDAVLLTPPAPQTAELVAASTLPGAGKATILEELAKARYRRCLTLTLGYAALHERPYYALVNSDKQHPVSWLAWEHLKPGRHTGGASVLVAQLGPAASEQHWDDPLEQLTATVAAMLSSLLDEDLSAPLWADRQGWRFALPDAGADFDTLNRAVAGLFFAGDYTAGSGRVHRAIEEGWKAAELISPLSTLPRVSD